MDRLIQRIEQHHSPTAEESGHEAAESVPPRCSGPVSGAEVLEQDLRGFGVLAGRAGLRKGRLQAIERRRGLAGQLDVAHGRAWRRPLACIRERDQVILLVKDRSMSDLFKVVVLRRQLCVAPEPDRALRHLQRLGDAHRRARLRLHQRREVGDHPLERVGQPAEQLGSLRGRPS